MKISTGTQLVVSIDGMEILVEHAEVTIDGCIPGYSSRTFAGDDYVIHPSIPIRKLHLVIDITDKNVELEYK